MKRLLATIVAAGMIGASVMVSHAASLHVTATTLQVLEHDGDTFPPPGDPSTSFEVRIHIFFFHGQQGHQDEFDDHVDVSVPDGWSYTISWQGAATASRTCPSERPTPPEESMFEGEGTFKPETGGDHVICLRRQSGAWNANSADADDLNVVVAP